MPHNHTPAEASRVHDRTEILDLINRLVLADAKVGVMLADINASSMPSLWHHLQGRRLGIQLALSYAREIYRDVR